jgi:tRNA threonylcarbamoyladenosine biosynthesis protein TsaB
MKILGIDTATAVASVALVEDGKLVAEEIQNKSDELSDGTGVPPRGSHAEIVIPLIQSMLAKTRMGTADLSGLAVSIGPGSFTGLRIGLATAKGIAYECGLPLVGVSTLHANAARVTGFEGIICSLLDARKSEVYFALFRGEADQIKRITEDAITPISGALEQVMKCEDAVSGSLLFIGDGARVYEKLLTSKFGVSAQISAGNGYSSVAAQVSSLAQRRFHAQMTDDIARLVPVYLRPSEAETKRSEYAVTC